uniref:ANK_REP_REGION domain-containing protein n=1 Tax=Rhabditophanes sp. KR3021 TaxID=114890 RepID=A0AC35UA97_9BILA
MTLACGSGHINIVNRVIAFTPVRTEKIEMTSLAPTPLMAAVFSNQLQICTLLYKRGIDLDTKHPNFLNLTALSLAIMFSPLKIPRLLIYYGANYQKKCFRNLTAEEMSHKYRNKSEVIELFSSPEEENSNNKNNLQNILLKNDIKVLKSYFEKKEGMSKEEFFSNGFTPLMFCVLVSNIECLKILGDEDYEIDAQDGYSTMTALMFAVLVGDQEMITYLMAKNADIRIKSKDNFTALDLAYLSNFISRDLLCKMEKAFYEVEIGFKDSFTSIKSNSSSASLMNRIKQPMKFAFFNKLSAVKTFGDSFEEEKSSDDNGRKRFLNQFEETKLKSIFSENFTTANDIIFNKKFFKTENDTKSNPYAVFAAKMAKVS